MLTRREVGNTSECPLKHRMAHPRGRLDDRSSRQRECGLSPVRAGRRRAAWAQTANMYGFSLVLLGVAPCAEVGLEDSWTPTADVVPATERVDATEDPTPTEEPTLVEQPTPAAITTPAPSPRTVTLGVGGDTSFGRYIRNGDFRPFGSRADVQAFAPILSAPDWTMLNLEAPIYSEVPPRIKRSGGLGHSLIFRSAPETADWLKEAGVDALSTANNHVEDCGEEGREETRRQLKAREIPFAGTVTPGDPFDATIIKEEGFTIALFAWSTKRNYGKIEPGRAPADVAYVKFANVVSKAEAYVAKARANHPDALVVFSLHWGQEYTERPSYPQIRAARRLIEAGVDLVVGH
ncbi:MAG: CapA family protein, partial [Nannocystaceae bacterium]